MQNDRLQRHAQVVGVANRERLRQFSRVGERLVFAVRREEGAPQFRRLELLKHISLTK